MANFLRQGCGVLLLVLVTGCGAKEDEEDDEIPLAPNVPVSKLDFYVSEYYAPSGHMGDGATAGHIVQDIDEGCLPRPAGAGGSCYHWQYTPGSLLWYGVYWQYPSNNWGNEAGRDISMWVPEPAFGPVAIRQRYNRVRYYAAATRGQATSVPVKFYAGDIGDPNFTTMHCADRTQPCTHRDYVSTSRPEIMLTSMMQPLSFRLTVPAPCVANAAGEEPTYGDNPCPEGTVRARSDGRLEVATCGGARVAGHLALDGSIVCCTTELVAGACPATSTAFAGSWKPLDEIYETVIGGFGWALNYAEYEQQVALGIANGTLPADATVDPATLPPTQLYIDDIVWEYVAQ
jgi:hypothetical protein